MFYFINWLYSRGIWTDIFFCGENIKLMDISMTISLSLLELYKNNNFLSSPVSESNEMRVNVFSVNFHDIKIKR